MDSEAVPKVAANNLFPIKNAPVFSLFFFLRFCAASKLFPQIYSEPSVLVV